MTILDDVDDFFPFIPQGQCVKIKFGPVLREITLNSGAQLLPLEEKLMQLMHGLLLDDMYDKTSNRPPITKCPF